VLGWRYFRSQLRPDLPDTPPVTGCLQRRDLGRAQVRPALKNIIHMIEKLVILEPQVAIGQRFECHKITERKMYMNVNEQAHDR